MGTNGEARYNKSLAFNIQHVYSQGEYDPSEYAQIWNFLGSRSIQLNGYQDAHPAEHGLALQANTWRRNLGNGWDAYLDSYGNTVFIMGVERVMLPINFQTGHFFFLETMSQPKSQSSLQVIWIILDILCMVGHKTTEPNYQFFFHPTVAEQTRLWPDTFMALRRVLTAKTELQRWVFEGEPLMPSKEFIFLGQKGDERNRIEQQEKASMDKVVTYPLVIWDSYGKSSFLIPVYKIIQANYL